MMSVDPVESNSEGRLPGNGCEVHSKFLSEDRLWEDETVRDEWDCFAFIPALETHPVNRVFDLHFIQSSLAVVAVHDCETLHVSWFASLDACPASLSSIAGFNSTLFSIDGLEDSGGNVCLSGLFFDLTDGCLAADVELELDVRSAILDNDSDEACLNWFEVESLH